MERVMPKAKKPRFYACEKTFGTKPAEIFIIDHPGSSTMYGYCFREDRDINDMIRKIRASRIYRRTKINVLPALVPYIEKELRNALQ